MERPAAKLADGVDGRHPERAGCGYFFLLLFLLPAADFQNEVQQILLTMTIIDMYDEIRVIFVLLTINVVGNDETQAFILDVMDDLGHVLKALSHLLFPNAGITDHVRDVAEIRPGAVNRLRGVKVNITR